MNILISGDYNAFTEGFDGAGVYMASGLAPSATFEKPIYIGSSVSLKSRIVYQHIPKLTTNEHANKPLQYSVNKNGLSNFVWFLLEVCQKDNTIEREQYYLDLYRPFCDEKKGFNISRSAKAPMLGRKHSKEAKEKISHASKNISTATRKLLSDAAKAKPRTIKSLKNLTAFNDARKRSAWLTHNETGATVKCHSLSAFAREHKLSVGNVHSVLSGKYRYTGGWRLATAKEIKKVEKGALV